MTAALIFAPNPSPAPSTSAGPSTSASLSASASRVSSSGDGATAGRPVSAEVYRRRRLAALALVDGMVLGVASFGRQADATPTREAEAAEAVSLVVQPGDTLWAIATELAPEADPRPLVSALSDLSGGASLQPGQILTIPGDLLD